MASVAYDEDLANRIRELIAGDPDVTEKKMFGGLAFLFGGNMSVGATAQGGLMVRVDPQVAPPTAGYASWRSRTGTIIVSFSSSPITLSRRITMLRPSMSRVANWLSNHGPSPT